MIELSLNILDITYNSLRAGAKNVGIEITADFGNDKLEIVISDDGCGMSAEMVKTVTDPFTTTRTTRKVGMGIPLFKMYAELCDGHLSIDSVPGKGTVIKAEMRINHVDRPPLGDIGMTMMTLIGASPSTEFELTFTTDDGKYVFDTREVKQTLDGVEIENVEILSFIKEMINENIENIIGGRII